MDSPQKPIGTILSSSDQGCSKPLRLSAEKDAERDGLAGWGFSGRSDHEPFIFRKIALPRFILEIDRPKHGEPIESFVLQPPYSEDREEYEKMYTLAEEATRAILSTCLSAAMNDFNKRE
jgi:hypothetical protein